MKNEINPFIASLSIETGRKIIDYSTYMNNKSVYDKNKDIPMMFLERANKVSLYTSPTIRKVLCELSGSALKLLIWIQQSILYGNDVINFNSKRFLRETNMSATTLVKVKKELIAKQIIAKKLNSRKQYWINPVIMFKGSRVKKYPDNVIAYKNNINTQSDSKIKIN